MTAPTAADGAAALRLLRVAESVSLQGTPSGDFGQVTAPTRFWGREAHVALRGAWGAQALPRRSGWGGDAGRSRTVDWLVASYRFSLRTEVYAVLDRNEVIGGYAKPAFMGTKGSQRGVVVGLRHRF